MRIDAHHHFWKYNADEFAWIGEGMERLQRDFLPGELHTEMEGASIDGVISVQARQTVAETAWLLDLAAERKFIKAVVGWVPLVSPNVIAALEQFMQSAPKLRGVRHVLQDEPDESFMLRRDFNAGVSKLKDLGLVYDILIFERHLPQTIEFVDRHPDQQFVLNHMAKPLLGKREMQPWAEHIRELARRKNVACKISGLVTEGPWKSWKEDDLQPYFDVVLKAFGPRRMMFGSDWPVCLVATKYARWVEAVEDLASGLSEEENDQLFGGTALRVYGVK